MQWGHHGFHGFKFHMPFVDFGMGCGPMGPHMSMSRARYRRYLGRYREWLQEELRSVEEEIEERRRKSPGE